MSVLNSIEDFLWQYPSIISIINVLILSITAFFIVKYWQETQRMKNEMVRQNEISNRQNEVLVKSFKGSNYPIIKVEVIKVENSVNTHNISIKNIGSGPAMYINATRLPHDENTQRVAITGIHTNISSFQKSISMLGPNESRKIHRDINDSVKEFTIILRYRDIFMENHEIEYRGTFNKIELKRFRSIGGLDSTNPQPPDATEE